MKKVVFGLTVLLLMSFQCESEGPEGLWYIKNQTDNVLRVSVSGIMRLKNGGFVLPGDSVAIHHEMHTSAVSGPSFEDFSVVDNIRVYDYDNDVELQHWIRAESEPGRYDIFDESQWDHYVKFFFIWTFSISNEDSGR